MKLGEREREALYRNDTRVWTALVRYLLIVVARTETVVTQASLGDTEALLESRVDNVVSAVSC